jgi:hypothetical protein
MSSSSSSLCFTKCVGACTEVGAGVWRNAASMCWSGGVVRLVAWMGGGDVCLGD